MTSVHLRRFSLLFLLVLMHGWISSQTPAFHPDSINRAWMAQVGGGLTVPAGNLSERFGLSGLAGATLSWKNGHNWLFEVGGEFLFGSDVREDTILNGITTDSGFVIGLDGLLYEPLLYERGFVGSVGLGKIIPVSVHYPNSGIMLGLRATFLQHKIFYSIKPDENVPQLNKEMRKGYDRLTNGWGLSEEIAWHNMSRSGLINFRIGLELIQAFTKNRRAYNFDAMVPDTETRMDLLFNLKIRWILPIWVRPRNAVIYYR
jgi:hypothetical protein